MAHRTTFLISPAATWAGDDYYGATPEGALNGLGGLLERIAASVVNAGRKEGTVLLTRTAAQAIRLDAPTTHDGAHQPALDSAAAAGWQFGKPGPFQTFYGPAKPTVYLGQLAAIRAAWERDALLWPWGTPKPEDGIAAMEHWHRLTGHAWRDFCPVVGVELIHGTMTSWRIPGSKGNRKVDKTDDGAQPDGATEAVWTPTMWSNPQLARWQHRYDRRRAGLTAAGVAKCSPVRLSRGFRKFDPSRAGWWLISVPPWQHAHMPHPCGPGAKTWERKWVQTATLELVAELAERGEVDMPEIIDSMTGPARPILRPFQELLEGVYQSPATDAYPVLWQDLVRGAVKQVAVSGVGMLANRNSSLWRYDWFASVTATKRANTWRTADAIGRAEQRWPVDFDDDAITYASDEEDPEKAAPKAIHPRTGKPYLNLAEDIAGAFKIEESRVSA